ncbi:MAG: hypothetical protein KKF44_08230 [Nanoarchaeota archaeon]|nr:hypothetical protein [Nanoarchaeota archaeon]
MAEYDDTSEDSDVEEKLDNDEIDAEEEGFIKGYESDYQEDAEDGEDPIDREFE